MRDYNRDEVLEIEQYLMDFVRINPNTKKTRTEIILMWIEQNAERFRDEHS